MGGKVLEHVNNFTDLGVIVSSDLSWDKYIKSCVKKANARLGLLMRTISYKACSEVKSICCKALVRPLLEYCTCLCSLIQSIESVQRKATKFIINNYRDCYKNRLILCDLLPLSYQR